MTHYRCVYENDVEADSPEEAAIECYRLMQDDGQSIRPIILVSSGPLFDETVEVDTDELNFTL